MARKARTTIAVDDLAAIALAYPEAFEDHPWGERVAKVRKKIFAFLDAGAEAQLGVKLPQSSEAALGLPGATPMGYGLGVKGWVVIPYATPDAPPLAVLADFIDESYRAVAPKRLADKADRHAKRKALSGSSAAARRGGQ